jgi:hypothetical protein
MFEKLPKGLVLKSETYDKGETFYTVILKERLFFPGIHKTISLYKNWEDDSSSLEVFKTTHYDSKDYSKYVKSGILKFPDNEEIKILEENIENLPRKIRNKIYGKKKINLINKINMYSDNSSDSAYGPTIQKISNLGLQKKLVS